MRRFSPTLIVFLRREWIETARSVRTFLIVALATAALFFFAVSAFPSSQEMASMAGSSRIFFSFYSNLMMFVPFLLMPGLGALAMQTERQKNTLELVLLTLVRPGEIVAGKIFASVSVFLMLVVATLPFAGLLFFLVGIDWAAFGASLLRGLLWAILFASVGVASGVRDANRREALSRAYGLALAWWFLGGFLIRTLGMLLFVSVGGAPGPAVYRSTMSEIPALLVVCAVCFFYARRKLLRYAVTPPPPPEPFRLRRDTKQPEPMMTHVGHMLTRPIAVRLTAYSCMVMILAGIFTGFMAVDQPGITPVVIWMVWAAFFGALLMIGPMATHTGIEHEQGTADLLRMTLLTPGQVTRFQRKSVLRSVRGFYWSLALGAGAFTTVLACYATSRRLHPLLQDAAAGILAHVSAGVAAWFALCLAQCVALCFRRSYAAIMASYGIVAAIFIVSGLQSLAPSYFHFWPDSLTSYWSGPMSSFAMFPGILHVSREESISIWLSGWCLTTSITLALSALCMFFSARAYARFQAKDH